MESMGNDIEASMEDAGDGIDSTATGIGSDIEEGVQKSR